jgi:hypothetical protein
MSESLTKAQLNKLTTYAELGNRYKYWSYLASLGDGYAKLALGVVTNETLSGYIANRYAEYGSLFKMEFAKMKKSILLISFVIMAACCGFAESLAQGAEANFPKKNPREVETGCTGEGISAQNALEDIIFTKTGFANRTGVRPDCQNVIVRPLDLYSPISIVRIDDRNFCNSGYCLTYIFNSENKEIIFMTEAKIYIDIGLRQINNTDVLYKFFNHKMINLYNVVRLDTHKGVFEIIFGFGDTPIIEFK